jgi:hypothetical protein
MHCWDGLCVKHQVLLHRDTAAQWYNNRLFLPVKDARDPAYHHNHHRRRRECTSKDSVRRGAKCKTFRWEAASSRPGMESCKDRDTCLLDDQVTYAFRLYGICILRTALVRAADAHSIAFVGYLVSRLARGGRPWLGSSIKSSSSSSLCSDHAICE